MKKILSETYGDRLTFSLLNYPEGKKSQIWLAEQVGATQGAVSQWCNNDVKPKNSHKIAEILQVRLEWLENGEEPIRKTDAILMTPGAFKGIMKKAYEKDAADKSEFIERIQKDAIQILDKWVNDISKSGKKLDENDLETIELFYSSLKSKINNKD